MIAFGALVRTEGTVSLKAMLTEVAAELGNTPAIARKSYIHPAVIEAVQAGAKKHRNLKIPRAARYISAEERGLIKFLGKA